MYPIIEYYSQPGKYIDLHVIKKEIKHIKDIQYNHNGIIISCILVSYDKIPSKSFQEKLKYYINGAIDYFTTSDNNLTSSFKKLNILITLNQIKKQFPNSYNINVEHANNGVTTRFADGTKYIYIYRIEDVYKVLIHEIIHYFDKDIKNNPKCLDIVPPKIDSLSAKWVDTRGKVNFNEAYTEAMAIFLYCKLSKQKLKKYITRGMCVAKALIEHANKYDTFYQKTNVLSYYIYRTALLLHLEEMLKNTSCVEAINLLEIAMKTFNKEIIKSKYKPLADMRVIDVVKNVF